MQGSQVRVKASRVVNIGWGSTCWLGKHMLPVVVFLIILLNISTVLMDKPGFTTPVKAYSRGVIIPDVQVCVACCQKSGNRVVLLNKKGENGAGLSCFEAFYKVSLAQQARNFATYICRPCKRNIDKYNHHIQEAEYIRQSLTAKCQTLHSSQVFKRVPLRSPSTPQTQNSQALSAPAANKLVSTPSNKSDGQKSKKKLCFSHDVSEMAIGPEHANNSFDPSTFNVSISDYRATSTPHSHSSRHFPDWDQTTIAESTEVTTSSGVLSSPSTISKSLKCSVNTVSRTQSVVFRSSKLARDLASIIKSLSQGSIKKGLKLLFKHYNADFCTVIASLVQIECKQFHKESNSNTLRQKSPLELLNLNMKDVENQITLNVPFTWSVLCSAAKNVRGIFKLPRVLTAALILLNSRSTQLNAFQYATAIALYHCHIQKEGLILLSSLGVTVSHTALNNKLNEAKELSNKQVEEWKKQLEFNDQNGTPTQIPASEENVHCQMTYSDHLYSRCPDQLPSSKDSNEKKACGFRLNIDNLDYDIHVRHMTLDHQNKSKHYVQAMAVRDRVNVEHLPLTNQEAIPLVHLPNGHFLPSPDDVHSMREDFIHVISLILIEHLPVFNNIFSKALDDTVFTHQYSDIMQTKSEVIPLGIFDKSENITNELIEVMNHLHKLVPGARTVEAMDNIWNRDAILGTMRPIPLGGDQLTCERVRGAHMAVFDQDTREERLEGLFSMVEDFHEKMNYLELIMNKYYRTTSDREPGTLHQLRQLINRRNVSNDVRKNYHAVADFVDLVTECHVLAAAMVHFGMGDTNNRPALFPRGIEVFTMERKRFFLKNMVGQLVDRFIYHKMSENLAAIQEGTQDHCPADFENDHINNYATGFMTHGLIRKVTLMTTAAGDGDRAMRNWKYALLAYHNVNKYKYRLESFLLLASVSSLLPPRLREQVKWGRFVNLSGGPGKNLDGDEVMELLNNFAKDRIKMLGPNHTPDVVMRIGQTIMFTRNVTVHLERQMKVAPISREHKAMELVRDRQRILSELLENAQVFQMVDNRQHPSFGRQPVDIYADVDVRKLHKWLSGKKREYNARKWAF